MADRPNGRLGYASAKRTQRTMIFSQTNPTSANEANRKIIVKTMFEHEQHDVLAAWPNEPAILRRALWPDGPEKQTKRSFFARANPSADQPAFLPNEPTRAAPSWLRTEAHSHTKRNTVD